MQRKALIPIAAIAALLLLVPGCTPPTKRAEQLIAQGKYEEAKQLMEGVLANNPLNPDYQFYTGLTYLYLKQFPKAERKFSEAIKLNSEMEPRIGQALVEAGKKFAAQGELDAAKFCFGSGLRRNPELKDGVIDWTYQRWTALENKETEEGEAYFFLLKQFKGEMAMVEELKKLEDKAVAAGNWAEAAKLVFQEVEAAPASMDVKDFYIRYLTFMSQSDDTAAVLEAFDGIIPLYPEESYFPVAAGIYLVEKGKIREALERFDEAKDLLPQSSAPFYGEAIANLKRDNAVVAKRAVKKGRRVEPKPEDGYVFFLRAKYNALRKSMDAARTDLLEALKRKPSLGHAAKLDPDLEPVRALEGVSEAINQAIAAQESTGEEAKEEPAAEE
jgi:tetratricopeptide (TPR) repeat protein